VGADADATGHFIVRQDRWGFTQRIPIPPGMSRCPICHGQGEVRPFKDSFELRQCWRCNGQGFVRARSNEQPDA